MKKILNFVLLFTSLLGYLEWGSEQHLFLFQAEFEIIKKGLVNPLSVLHPFILLPFLGQILLLITLFQNEPKRAYTLWGILGIGILMVMLFVVGILSYNYKIVLSTLPFLVAVLFTLKKIKKNKVF